MLSRADVLRYEIEVGGADADRVEADELSCEPEDVGRRRRDRELVVGPSALARLLASLPGDDEQLEFALAERRDRGVGGFDAIRRAVDADGDVVVSDARIADGVERRDEPVGGSEPQ